jgi:hypothetical protein
MNSLRILQYNVRKSKRVIEPLLAEDQVALYNIIAIQEPWKNPTANRTYCPSAADFTPAYDDYKRRACFLIHKRLDTIF